MNNLECIAEHTIIRYKMLEDCNNIIVALSGGADSVALLHFLLTYSKSHSCNVMAVHVNHNLRGKEAERDEAFVRDICNAHNVELFVKSIDINRLAEEQKISTELCGRNERYNYFKELSEKYSAKVATAHTASDNTETVIFNLVRGTGVKGMTGIRPVRDYIIRPLIHCTRQQIEEYCCENALDFVTDSSNLTDDYTRNKIRHNVIPCLKEINPHMDSTFVKNGFILSDVNDYLNQQADAAIIQATTKNGYDSLYLNGLHNALKNMVLYNICKKADIDVEYKHIQLLSDCLKSGGAVDLYGNYRAVVKQNTLRIVNTSANTDNGFFVDFQANLSFEFSDKKYNVTLEEADKVSQYIDPDLAQKGLFFRTRRSGDVFTLPYRKVTKTVKKLFNELKIPAEKRDKLLLLTDDKTVYWIESVGVSQQGITKVKQGIKITVNI